MPTRTDDDFLAQVRTRGRLLLECEGSVPLRFADGAPALAISEVDRGKTALLATSLDADWTDLPLRPGYLPLLSQLVRTVANAVSSVRGSVVAGSPLELGVPPHASMLEVVAPDGERHRCERAVLGGEDDGDVAADDRRREARDEPEERRLLRGDDADHAGRLRHGEVEVRPCDRVRGAFPGGESATPRPRRLR